MKTIEINHFAGTIEFSEKQVEKMYHDILFLEEILPVIIDPDLDNKADVYHDNKTALKLAMEYIKDELPLIYSAMKRRIKS